MEDDMDIRNAPVFFITMLLNPDVALRVATQLQPEDYCVPFVKYNLKKSLGDIRTSCYTGGALPMQKTGQR
jgi:hypothetical protein